jgi:hypothetical protein
MPALRVFPVAVEVGAILFHHKNLLAQGEDFVQFGSCELMKSQTRERNHAENW